MTLYNVSTTDRSRHRRIEANTPGEALRRFVGRRLANAQLSHWTEDGNEAFYNLSVSIYDRPYRSGRDPVRSIHGHVWLDQAPACNTNA